MIVMTVHPDVTVGATCSTRSNRSRVYLSDDADDDSVQVISLDGSSELTENKDSDGKTADGEADESDDTEQLGKVCVPNSVVHKTHCASLPHTAASLPHTAASRNEG